MAKRKARGTAKAARTTGKRKTGTTRATKAVASRTARPKTKPGARAAKKKVAKTAKPAARKPAAKKVARKVPPQAAKRAAPSKGKPSAVNPKKTPLASAASTKRPGPPKGRKVTAASRQPKLSAMEARRRELERTVPSPPSSLDMDRRGTAARTGRAEMAESRADHASMTPSITGGDVDADVENAYFSGDEAPGGDNPTPDQDIVDDIGRALGVEYQDNEELRASDKVADRDKHRWELDPASSEDYRDRD